VTSVEDVLSGKARWCILHGELPGALAGIPDATFSACLTDPPYGLGSRQPSGEDLLAYLGGASLDTGGDFMCADWQIPSVAVWKQIERVLKPGSYMLSFAGSRTQDLITLGIRAGGFEVKETLMWLQAEGMAKPAMTTGKLIDKHLGVERPVTHAGRPTSSTLESRGGDRHMGGLDGRFSRYLDRTGPGSQEAEPWEEYGHALAPSHEPIVLARKPLDGTIAESVLAHRTGALNIGGCRTGLSGGTRKVDPEKHRTRGSSLEGSTDGSLNGGVKESTGDGRWPKNVIFSHSALCVSVGTREVRSGTAVKRNGVTNSGALAGMHDLGAYPEGTPDAGYATGGKETVERWECHPSCPVRMLDEQTGDRPSTLTGRAAADTRHANPGDNSGASSFGGGNSSVYADAGGASRFFFCAKVSTAEREYGCEQIEPRDPGRPHNDHTTLKPIEITRWLATLIRPPFDDAVLLVPYSGSGSEVVGALRAGWKRVIGVERDAHFVEIARTRISRWEEAFRNRPRFTVAEVVASVENTVSGQRSLF